MENPAELAASKLAREMESWTSIELRFHEDQEDYALARRSDVLHGRDPIESRYIETSSGQRVFERTTPIENEPETVVSISYCDGSRSAALLRRYRNGVAGPEQVAITRFFQFEETGYTYRPHPLWCLYAGLEPLHRALARSTYLGEDRLLDRTCDRFLITRIRGPQDTMLGVFWLDRATAMPLKIEIFEDEATHSQGRPLSVWRALTLDEIDGHHLARRSEVTKYRPRGPNPDKPVIRDETIVDKVIFDQSYPAETFWPRITENTTVLDYVKNTISSPKKAADASATTVSPLRAVDGGWMPTSSAVALVLGIAAIITGLGLWWRRR